MAGILGQAGSRRQRARVAGALYLEAIEYPAEPPAVQRHLAEQPSLGEGLIGDQLAGGCHVRQVEQQHAADLVPAGIVVHRPARHDRIGMFAEVVPVRLAQNLALGRAARMVERMEQHLDIALPCAGSPAMYAAARATSDAPASASAPRR